MQYVRAGLPDREIARHMRVSRTTVWARRRAAGLPANRTAAPPRCHLTDRQREKAVKLRAGGATFADIAHHLGVTRSAVAGVIYRDRQKHAA